MGTIQNSINQGIGAVGTATALGQHLAEQKKNNTISALEAEDRLAKEQAIASEENALTTAQLKESKAELKKNNEQLKKFKDFKEGKLSPEDTQAMLNEYPELGTPAGNDEAINNINKDIVKIKTAKKELLGKQKAQLEDMRLREEHLNRIREITKLRGGNA
jgi:hypothetical protein